MTTDNPYDLTGRVAVVTGAARGIGRACALRLARAGADVVIVDRDLEAAKEFGESLGAESVPAEIEAMGRRSAGYQADLTDQAAVDATVDAIARDFGRIDILVNMAGGMITPADRSKPSVVPIEDIDRVFAVNLNTVVFMSQAVARVMKTTGGGSIVSATGQSAITTYKQGLLANYGASKIAVLYFMRALAAELGPDGIRANCVSPGVTLTSRIASTAGDRGVGTQDEIDAIPLRRFAQPDDIAKAVEFLASDMAGYISGQCLSVCGGAVLTPN
ncbi:SDR family NAD(P)-dependent oxidoreductase [Frondihabitans cladoniiphilus]|uniref:Glucose 1-dehydrogenase n=1 Tax=Frondihabitans cladoniiphilus TaxID=715785 RepID=A0ABP8WB30_9MICO